MIEVSFSGLYMVTIISRVLIFTVTILIPSVLAVSLFLTRSLFLRDLAVLFTLSYAILFFVIAGLIGTHLIPEPTVRRIRELIGLGRIDLTAASASAPVIIAVGLALASAPSLAPLQELSQKQLIVMLSLETSSKKQLVAIQNLETFSKEQLKVLQALRESMVGIRKGISGLRDDHQKMLNHMEK